MIGLIQRVSFAQVLVDNSVIGRIEKGILALVGIEKQDNLLSADKLIDRIIAYRIFSDSNDKMNLSLRDINAGLLLVPQFTLAADTNKGLRPSFSSTATPEEAKRLFDHCVIYAKQKLATVATGEFGAYMQVSLCNDGPVTFMIKI